MLSHIVPLEMLRAGERGEVVDILGNEQLVTRLAEKGLRCGCRLEALSPGNPFLFRVDQTQLSLRSDGQVDILIRLDDN